jgi:hypothetical protein
MEIKFNAAYDFSGLAGNKPVPSSRSLPAWYSKMPRFRDSKKTLILNPNGETNATIKACNPFLDSLTAGYTVLLENEVQVVLESGKPVFSWKNGGKDFVSFHDKYQIKKEMIPKDFQDQPFKFLNPWSITTPKGYSVLITHPLNRADLPFYTLSGVVDTDDYSLPINLPFFLKKNFEGIIPAGTPIAQVIPFKRESWKSSIIEYNEDFDKGKKAKFNSIIHRSYKKLFWKRKDYL